MKSRIWLGLTLALLAGHAWAATNSGQSVVFIPGVANGPCSSWPTCPAVPNDITHPFYFAPSTGASFAVTGNVTITPSGTQTVTGSVSVSGSALPSNAAQETGGNLAAVAGSTASTATSTGTTTTNTTAISTGTGTPADSAYSGSGSGSLIAIMKWIGATLKGTLTVSGTVTTTPSGSGNQPVIAGSTTPAAPDISTVTTGGTAVAAFSAGHCARGCILINPAGATQSLCVNGTGATASGTTTAGALICIPPGQQYGFTARATAISAVSSDSSHAFGGEGYQ